MTRSIDADALLEAYKNSKEIRTYDYDIARLITNAPTVQREGWVSVPIEPTEEMKRALFKNLIHADDEAYVIKAIIEAAPKE